MLPEAVKMTAGRQRYKGMGWRGGLWIRRGRLRASRPATRLPGIESVDIYPFMARVLELEPAEGIEGDAGALAALARR